MQRSLQTSALLVPHGHVCLGGESTAEMQSVSAVQILLLTFRMNKSKLGLTKALCFAHVGNNLNCSGWQSTCLKAP